MGSKGKQNTHQYKIRVRIMWWLTIFYFLTLSLSTLSAQGVGGEKYSKIILLFVLLIGYLAKRKIKQIDSVFISLACFLVFGIYSALRGIDINNSLPLLLGLTLLYFFVKTHTDTLSLLQIKKTILAHSWIINVYVLITLLAMFFFPSWVDYLPGDFHPYAGLAKVPATSAAILLGGLFFNALSFILVEKKSSKLINLILCFFTFVVIFRINARTTELSILLFLAMAYFCLITHLNESNFKSALLKFLFLFLPLLGVLIVSFYVLRHITLYSHLNLFHQEHVDAIKGFTLDGRTTMWAASFNEFIHSSYVLRGVGYGNAFYFLELCQIVYLTTHNILIDMLYSTGVIGCLLFLCFIIFSLLGALKNYFLTHDTLHWIFFMSLLTIFFQSQGESSLNSLMTTHLYLWILFYTFSMKLGSVKK